MRTIMTVALLAVSMMTSDALAGIRYIGRLTPAQKVARSFARADHDRNGVLTRQEVAASGVWPNLTGEDSAFKDADANHDNHLSLRECHRYFGTADAAVVVHTRSTSTRCKSARCTRSAPQAVPVVPLPRVTIRRVAPPRPPAAPGPRPLGNTSRCMPRCGARSPMGPVGPRPMPR